MIPNLNPYSTIQTSEMKDHYNLIQTALKNIRPSEKSLPMRRPHSAVGYSKYLKT